MISGSGIDMIGLINSAEAEAQIQRLSQDVTTLKNDKLDLLRQNVVSFTLRFKNNNQRILTLLFIIFVNRLAREKSNICENTNSHCKVIWRQLAKKFCDYAIF